MSIKNQVLKELEHNKGGFISGGQLSEELGVSRNAVWKAIKSLEKEGHLITAIPNKGYCLSAESNILSSQSIDQYLRYKLDINVYDTITSTNTVLKEMAEQGSSQGTILVAGQQTLGRGRMGKSFYSPSNTGIYMSILVRPNIPAGEALFLTTSAAVAVARAIEVVSDKNASIKWVNDIYIEDKKVCGILTEGSFNMENGQLDYAIVGIGINICPPEEGFPNDIDNIATSIFDCQEQAIGKRDVLVAEILNNFFDFYNDFKSKKYVKEYKDRSMLIGRDIYVLKNNSKIEAYATDIDDNCRLKVRYSDGTEEWLNSGEVSTKIKNS